MKCNVSFFGRKVDFALLWLIGEPVVEAPGGGSSGAGWRHGGVARVD